jgi:drug/metabolite transporter (DMT)-like permease
LRILLLGQTLMETSWNVYIGPMAGVTTSILWTGTSLAFTAAGRRLGPTIVNSARILLAIFLHAATFRLLTGGWIPDVVGRQVMFLALSGIIGLSIGDQALFTAFVDIGPRLAMLVMTTAPLMAAAFGWVVLEEAISGVACLGMAMTIGGVAWVVMERGQLDRTGVTHHRVRGIALAVVASACQAGGLLLSKQGMGHGWLPADHRLDPQAATLLRMVFAGLGMVPILGLHAARERRRHAIGLLPAHRGSWRTGLMFASLGAVFGPFLGVWMSLVASDRARSSGNSPDAVLAPARVYTPVRSARV